MTKHLQELRIVFAEDGVQFHVTYTHDPDAKGASGALSRSVVTTDMARDAMRFALRRLEANGATPNWLGYSTNYVRTTDSIGVDG